MQDRVGKNDDVRQLLRRLDAHSPGEFHHAERVAVYATCIGDRLGITGEDLYLLKVSAQLHDIGKLSIPATILGKKNGLLAEERSIVEEHVSLAETWLKTLEWAMPCLPWIASHHERFDGTGYPSLKRGEEIPLFSRIIHACEVYDAVSYGSYTEGRGREIALEVLAEEAGHALDPEVVKLFPEISDKIVPARDCVFD